MGGWSKKTVFLRGSVSKGIQTDKLCTRTTISEAGRVHSRSSGRIGHIQLLQWTCGTSDSSGKSSRGQVWWDGIERDEMESILYNKLYLIIKDLITA